MDNRIRRSTYQLTDWVVHIRHQIKVTSVLQQAHAPKQLTIRQAFHRPKKLEVISTQVSPIGQIIFMNSLPENSATLTYPSLGYYPLRRSTGVHQACIYLYYCCRETCRGLPSYPLKQNYQLGMPRSELKKSISAEVGHQ
jgi:hypothetical protein